MSASVIKSVELESRTVMEENDKMSPEISGKNGNIRIDKIILKKNIHPEDLGQKR